MTYTKESKSEIPEKFFPVVLETDGDQSDPAKNEEVLNRVKEEGNILHAMKRRRTNSHLGMNCFLKHVTERNIEGTERRGRRRKQLLDDNREKKDNKHCIKEAVGRTV